MNHSVSVIIPIYNRSQFLSRVVESVLVQTLPVTEIIIVDDGSTDDTPELLPRYVAENPRWRERVLYFRQENQGPGVARNNGIARAKGEWVAFNDDDDLWLPQKLEWQFRAIEQFQQECGVCITDAWFMNNPHMKMTLFQLAGKQHAQPIGMIHDPIRYMIETNSPVGIHPVWMQNLVTRTELARRIGGFDPKLRCGEDDDFAFRLGCETKFCFVNMPMVIIDRTPPPERHIGANRQWDEEEFRLKMAQLRYEKRSRLSEHLPKQIRRMIRRDLAAVHSGWANWYLQRAEIGKAREAATKAVNLCFTPNLAAKWILTQFLPRAATIAVSSRQERQSRRTCGIG